VGSSCDSGTSLLLGRDGKGPEPNQPNTINASCADGTSGTFHSDESNDRLKVSTLDGTSFATGKTVRVEATVWAWTSPSADHLELYYAANAASPTWTLIGTLTPTAAGAQTLSATYTLPAGSLQAVRAQFRYQGSASACTSGSYNDHDDLVFAVP
jgi:leucyl aminopeptidase